jgi:hypothetical protein
MAWSIAKDQKLKPGSDFWNSIQFNSIQAEATLHQFGPEIGR